MFAVAEAVPSSSDPTSSLVLLPPSRIFAPPFSPIPCAAAAVLSQSLQPALGKESPLLSHQLRSLLGCQSLFLYFHITH